MGVRVIKAMNPGGEASEPAPLQARIIQGGMGAGVSNWRLARAVTGAGGLGIVSGTALDAILVRRLQDGDRDGAMRRALARFPDQAIARRILDRYFVAGGRPEGSPYRGKPMVGVAPDRSLVELLIAGNYVEVLLAKEGREGPVGINYLEKIQTPLLPSLFGAMLAGVDVVTMGAGIPIKIAGVLDRLAESLPVEYELSLSGRGDGAPVLSRFDPNEFPTLAGRALERPRFLPIVSSVLLASLLVKKSNGRIDGLIVEYNIAGGHNAPPRGRMQIDERGEPVYGPRDEIDLGAIRNLGLPFWLAGAYGSPEALGRALDAGATGVQVGTLFAFSRESGLRDDLKRDALRDCLRESLRVRSDPLASPSGFPFKVLEKAGTNSEAEIYTERERICDLGYLREAHRREDGRLVWRCPGEPLEDWLRKEGAAEAIEGRKCLCNALMANVGLQQTRPDGREELPLLTCGSDMEGLRRFATGRKEGYGAVEVMSYLLSDEIASTLS